MEAQGKVLLLQNDSSESDSDLVAFSEFLKMNGWSSEEFMAALDGATNLSDDITN